ncbi:carboxypeptidase M32 [Paludisphaera borealis]|uniref:Thermostable carboxypeptidase 1 n=1 Tax=Paludisphaera borealis TaxID=1387353 RepID=A0A1U7CJU5_9BACT|nr:carboxypeptidase M32 [Paludisphaera borealis]APW59199.1 Thermostable carboxypeptidase 1 [Paludisphaera borealis]
MPTSTSKAAKETALYDELIGRSRELTVLGSCSAVLGWDEQTYMPAGAAAHRGEQLALLAGLQHDRATESRLGELLSVLENSSIAADRDSIEAANIRQLRRDYDRRTKLPRGLVEALARTTSLAQQEWITARKNSDFASFRPWLEQVLELKRQESQCLHETLVKERRAAAKPAHPEDEPKPDAGATIYDPLLDQYEPGAETSRLRILFKALREELAPFVRDIAEASRKREARGEGVKTSILERSYPVERQKMFGEAAAAALGFDFQRGRLDVSAHPFCTGIGPGDVRATTRFDARQFSDAFFGVLHEVGHGLYEQGLPVEQYGAPGGEAVSLGVHESQSRLWENAVGRSRPFWNYWFPIARRVFQDALHDVPLDAFLAAVNHVEPTLIRVQADEVTYNLHILIRFELEQALLTGDLPVADLPSAWNAKYAEMLGVTPTNDAEGCLQDIHWSAGLFGYFPTYTLGNLYAAQLFHKANADLPGLDDAFTRGEFSELLAWLRDKIHRHGRRYTPTELIERAVGEPIDHRPLMASLRHKYGALYGV